MARLNYLGSRLTHSGLSIPEHDYVSMTYAGTGNAGADDPTTITYKKGGSGGTTVATLTLTYAATGRVSTITRS
tara:strand:+ start:345 stop:566 length:222 start_codon:yes stop_codon:yes gene_type:complete